MRSELLHRCSGGNRSEIGNDNSLGFGGHNAVLLLRNMKTSGIELRREKKINGKMIRIYRCCVKVGFFADSFKYEEDGIKLHLSKKSKYVHVTENPVLCTGE